MTIAWSRALGALLLSCVLFPDAVPARSDEANSDSTSRSITLPPIDVRGFMQLDYRLAFRGTYRDEFGVRRARVSLAGNAVPRVSYRLELQADRANQASLALLDAYADVEIVPVLRLRVGQNRYFFDIEGSEPDEFLPVLDRSWAANAVAGTMNGQTDSWTSFDNFHDRGITLLSGNRRNQFKWRVDGGVYQGSGRRPDVDNEVGYVARVQVASRGLTLSYGWMGNPLGSPYLSRYSAWTGGLEHKWRWSHLRAEYYEGQSQYGIDLGGSDAERRGGYVLEVIRLHRSFDVSARWQGYQPEYIFYGHPDAIAVDAGCRFHFLRAGQRSNTWVALGWMGTRLDRILEDAMSNLGDGIIGYPYAGAEEWRHLVVARFQVAF